MKVFTAVTIVLCMYGASLAAVSYDAGTLTLTYNDPADLDAVIDPIGLADVQREDGMTKGAFQALNPQVIGFNTYPAGQPTVNLGKVVAKYNAADTVTFTFPAVMYEWPGRTSSGRKAFSGTLDNHYFSGRESFVGATSSWFDATISTGTGPGVTALGMCVHGRDNLPTSASQALFSLSDGSQATVNIPEFGQGKAVMTIFVGYQAPAGLTINQVQVLRLGGGTSYLGIDDLAFVVTPEPTTLGLLALAGLVAARRRRA